MESVSMPGSSPPYVSTLGTEKASVNGSITAGTSATAPSDLYSLGGKSANDASGMMELIETLVQMMIGFIERLMSQFLGGSMAPQQGAPSGNTPTTQGMQSGAEPAPSSGAHEAPATPERALEAIVDDKGETVILTKDGYAVRCEGKQEAWTITGPDGKITRIWGDPHVQESDGDRWDFTERSSFTFGHNKITVEVKPLENGTSLTSQITVYNENERVTVSQIDENKPQITSVSSDGREHDAGLSDGKLYKLQHEAGGQEEEWSAQP